MTLFPLPRFEPEEPPARGAVSLLEQFREFHGELMGIREALSMGDRMAEQGQPLPNPAEVAVRINRRLHRLLDGQAATALRFGGRYGGELYREAQYLMVALADETLLHGDNWGGKDHWLDNLLEMSLFGTRVAGERVFQRLDSLLADRAAVDPDLLSIYLAVLSLGFRGRYYRPQDEPHLRRYRTALAQRLKTDGVRPHLCPDAYAATVAEGRVVRLPHLRPWVMGMGIVVGLFAMVAHGIWYTRTERIRDLTTAIETAAEATQPAPAAGAPGGGARTGGGADASRPGRGAGE
ncbi:MAG: hypothetical protein RLY86_4179 [Pseudomonadota bacterium]|jgi:type VI secretion system protein ImpK